MHKCPSGNLLRVRLQHNLSLTYRARNRQSIPNLYISHHNLVSIYQARQNLVLTIKLLFKVITPGRCSKLSLEVIKHRLSTSNHAYFIKTIKFKVVEMISYRYSWSNHRQSLWHNPPLIKRQSSSGVTIVLIPSKMRTRLKSTILL